MNAAYCGEEITVWIWLQMAAVMVKATLMFLDIHENVLKQSGTMLKLKLAVFSLSGIVWRDVICWA